MSASKVIAKAKVDYDKAKAKGDTKGMAAAHATAEAERAKSGYSGGVDGSQKISLGSTSKSSGSSSANKTTGTTATGTKAATSAPIAAAKSGSVSAANVSAGSNAASGVSNRVSSLYGLVGGKAATSVGGTPTKAGNVASSSNLTDQQQMAANSAAWKTADEKTKKQLEAANQTLGTKLGLTYNSAAGTWSQPAASVATPAAASGGVTKTTYTDASQQTQTGYNIGGHIYQDAAGTKPIAAGSVVGVGDKKYLMTAEGKGLDITNSTTSKVYQVDPVTGKVDTSAPIKTLYNVNGTNYDPTTGQVYRTTATNGQVVKTANGQYYDALTGQDVTAALNAVDALPDTMPVVSEDASIQDLAKQAYAAATEIMKSDPTLTWEQALGMATENLNGSYNAATDAVMSTMDKNALNSGFFGQLPTEALKRNTAASIEVQKQQAINELATSLYNQSTADANTKLAAATEAQQNKVANMLSLLGVATNERDSANTQALNEASLTGSYKGKSTLDFLNYLLDKSNSNKK